MDEVSPRWALPLLHAGQAQKELFHNEALLRLDMLVHGAVASADLTVAPGVPDVGACWIVAAGATGAWAGHDGDVAFWTAGGWRFVAPRAGLRLLVTDRGHGMFFDGTDWRDAMLRVDGLHVDGARVVGARQAAIAGATGGATIDVQVRETVDAILDTLRAHGLIGA